jgi:hypothetical protein
MPDAPPATEHALLFLHIPKTAGSTLGRVVTYQYAPAAGAEKLDQDPEVPLYDGTYWPPFDAFDTYYPPSSTTGRTENGYRVPDASWRRNGTKSALSWAISHSASTSFCRSRRPT